MAGTLLVSLDFELFWGMLDVCPLEKYEENILGGRRAIPRLLRLFRDHGIHATWAAVGFLFAENKEEARKYFPDQKPTYRDPKLDPYAYFETIGEDENTAPCFFCPGLIKLVAETPGQEIGSHSFCHFYCGEQGQTLEQFRSDMCAAKDIALDHGYDLTSVILPRNQCSPDYSAVLSDLGFTAYRDVENDWIHKKLPMGLFRRALQLLDIYLPLTGLKGVEPQKENGIWNFDGTRMYKAIRPAVHFLEPLKIRRIKSQMRYAAKHDKTFHLWWHPHNIGVLTEEHLQQLEEIFSYYEELKETYGMRSLNMREAAQLLDEGRW